MSVQVFDQLDDRQESKHLLPPEAYRIARAVAKENLDPDPYGPVYQVTSMYFDTDSLAFYRAQKNKDVPRLKLRTRNYSGSKDTFYEVKIRTADRTVKHRISRGAFADYGAKAVARVRYEREAWQSKGVRLTIDSNARCMNTDGQWLSVFPGLRILEFKLFAPTQFADDIRRVLNLQPQQISKFLASVELIWFPQNASAQNPVK